MLYLHIMFETVLREIIDGIIFDSFFVSMDCDVVVKNNLIKSVIFLVLQWKSRLLTLWFAPA